MKTSAQPTVRLFFAALPDVVTRDRLAAAAAALAVTKAARLVPPESFHVTLAFVGNVAATRLELLAEIGREQRSAAFALQFDAHEYWPKPEVVVATARAIPAPLESLWRQLHHRLAEHEMAPDPKRLRPHVTLARKVSQAPVFQALSPVSWLVNKFCLMRSDTRESRSAYTVVDTWSLLDESCET